MTESYVLVHLKEERRSRKGGDESKATTRACLRKLLDLTGPAIELKFSSHSKVCR